LPEDKYRWLGITFPKSGNPEGKLYALNSTFVVPDDTSRATLTLFFRVPGKYEVSKIELKKE
jgi:hypothetical protein